jgi:hypothetical protein
MHRKWFLFAVALAGLWCFAPPRLTAQTTGAIEGTLTDSSEAAIPGATVKLTDEKTGVDYITTTNSSGYFLVENLPVGVYSISVSQQGFKAYSVTGIILDAASRVRQNIRLAVGQLSESVTVQASAARVETADGTVGAVITNEQLDTAVLNGRHYARMAMMMPGSVYHSSSDELAGAGLNGPDSPVSINGLNNKSEGWFVDGALDINFGNGQANTHVPVIDSLEEMHVQTSNYSARYGTAGGVIINAVTRSGTNTFHGSAYEYLRNDKLDARNFFALAPPPLKQNQYGFTVGGPILISKLYNGRNKTFFFWSEDWRTRHSASTALTATPTDAMRAGNFQAEAVRLGKPILDPANKLPFANNIIPQSRINANAALLLKTYFPEPNYNLNSFNNYINNGVATLEPRTDTVKVDHNLSEKIRLSFTFSNDYVPVLQPNGGLTGSPFPVIRQFENTTGQTGNARVNFILSPRTTNEVSYSLKRYGVVLELKDDKAPQVRPAGLTIKDFYSGANTLNLIPQISFSGGWGSISTNQLPLDPARDDNQILTDNLGHIFGTHSVQTGSTWFHFNKTQAAFNTTQGAYAFDGSFTNDPVADFMTGYARSYTESNQRYVRTYSFDQTEFYLQDDWRVNRKLTINAGARLFVMPMIHVDGNLQSSFLPSAFNPKNALGIDSAGNLIVTPTYDPLNGLVFPEKNGVPRGFVNTFVGFAPRFGFAFDPSGNGKMAIRGGYGISYLNIGNDNSSLITNPPYNYTVSLQNVQLDDPSGGTPNVPRPVALSAFDPNFKRPMIQSWSLTVQRELPGQFLVSAGYVGTRSTNDEVWIDQNLPDFLHPAGYNFDPRLNAGYNSNLIRPYQGYASITTFTSGASSSYHSLQTTFQRRFANNFAVQGSYTFGKAIGEAATARNPTPQNPLYWRGDRGPTDFDATHVFTSNYIYNLPLLRGRRDLLGQAFGNWQISGVLAFQSGLALSPGDSLSSRGEATRPNATGVSVDGPKTIAQWFNTADFTAPSAGFYGNAGRGVLRGPGFAIWDAAASKSWLFKDRAKLSFKGEFFNVLNHTNFSGVSTSLGSGTYGQITSARDPRKIQLSMKFEF